MLTDKDAFSIIEAFACYDGLVRSCTLDNRGNFTKTQMMILIAIDSVGSLSLTHISERLAISKEQATRAVAALEKDGFISKARGVSNWKVVEVNLTQQAKDYLVEHKKRTIQALSSELRTLSDEETNSLVSLSRDAAKLLKESFFRKQTL